MPDRSLPLAVRLVLLATGLMQLGFGLTMLLNPTLITQAWPWPLSPIDARLLGASSLVSVPLSIFTALLNRYSAARIPMVMLLAYRVLQILAGLIHLNRFDFTRFITWNYFGGGAFLGLVLIAALALGPRLGRPVDAWPALLRDDAPLRLGPLARILILVFAALYFLIGLTLLVLGARGVALWFERPEAVSALTLRLFASPTTGLALGLYLITRARHWRQVAIPALGLATIGVAGTLALLLELRQIAPASLLGYYTAITPLLLFVLGIFLLLPGRSPARATSPAAAPRRPARA